MVVVWLRSSARVTAVGAIQLFERRAAANLTSAPNHLEYTSLWKKEYYQEIKHADREFCERIDRKEEEATDSFVEL